MLCAYDSRSACEGEAVTTRQSLYGPEEPLCAACAAWWDNREPSDDDLVTVPVVARVEPSR